MNIVGTLLAFMAAQVSGEEAEYFLAGEERPVAQGSDWSLRVPHCSVKGRWWEPGHVTIELLSAGSAGAYLIDVTSDSWRNLPELERFLISFGIDNAAPEYSAPATAGFQAASGQNVLARVHGSFLERMAGARSLQVYRDGQSIMSRELGAVAEAIEAMRDCERETEAALQQEN